MINLEFITQSHFQKQNKFVFEIFFYKYDNMNLAFVMGSNSLVLTTKSNTKKPFIIKAKQ